MPYMKVSLILSRECSLKTQKMLLTTGDPHHTSLDPESKVMGE